MIQIEETIIRKIIYHKITNDELSTIFSEDLFDFHEDEEKHLRKIFLKPFLGVANSFEFKHEINLEYNVLFQLTKKVYNQNNFIDTTKEICKHLLSVSKHPNIKDGDLFIIQFEDIKYNNIFYEGIGIYKFEEKESFIELITENGKIKHSFKKGIGSKKPEKACIILFTKEPYTIFIHDNNSHETDYWQNDFIGLVNKNDDINSTNKFLDLTKSYILNKINTEFELTKVDQVDLLNKSISYFKNNENFEKKDFEKVVFSDSSVIKSFKEYSKEYLNDKNNELSESFEISPYVVKKQAKSFNEVIKLDKNFHIYIHGNKELIEHGIEKNGRKFYKIFYEKES